MDAKGIVFIIITIVLLIFFARLYFSDLPPVVYVPKYIPNGYRKHKHRRWKKRHCKICSGCGKLGKKGFCCAKPLNDFFPPQCLPNLSKEKCELSNTTFDDFEYTWCHQRKSDREKERDDDEEEWEDDNGEEEWEDDDREEEWEDDNGEEEWEDNDEE